MRLEFLTVLYNGHIIRPTYTDVHIYKIMEIKNIPDPFWYTPITEVIYDGSPKFKSGDWGTPQLSAPSNGIHADGDNGTESPEAFLSILDHLASLYNSISPHFPKYILLPKATSLVLRRRGMVLRLDLKHGLQSSRNRVLGLYLRRMPTVIYTTKFIRICSSKLIPIFAADSLHRNVQGHAGKVGGTSTVGLHSWWDFNELNGSPSDSKSRILS